MSRPRTKKSNQYLKGSGDFVEDDILQPVGYMVRLIGN